MKVSEDTQQARGSQKIANILGVLAIVSILLMVASFGAVSYYGAFDREYISRADAVRVLSQRLAKNASEAANGKIDAFANLKEAREELQTHMGVLENGNLDSRLPATAEMSEEAARALEKIKRPWESTSAQVEEILARREMVIRANELAEQFRVNVPKVQALTEDLAQELIASDAARDQVYAATRAMLYAERIGRHVGEMVRGGIGNMTASERLGSSTDQLGRTIAA